MRRLTRLVVLMALAMLLTTDIAAQQNASFHRQQGDYTFGVNAGLAYQKSDVASNLSGFGLGLTYGKNFIYSPNAPFSFDVRTRFQIARSFGTDIRPSFGIAQNDALNGENTLDYTGDEEGGFVYANHKTNHAEAGLEGVLTLNGLRESTGMALSFVGGVGLHWYKAKIDQRNDAGLYTDQYSLVDAGGAKPFNLSQLKGFRDGEFETLADDFGRLGKFGIMPSMGIEIDYDLSNNVALGVGHRVTFSGTDLLDGQRWTDANALTGNNDILHYTSLGLKYTFNKKGSNKNHRKPTIELITPYGNDLSSTKSLVPIKATINRVDNPFDIYLMINGREQSFNFNNHRLNGQIRLQSGENRIEIAANNSAGRTTKTFFITYRTADGLDGNALDFGNPEIEFITPNKDNIKVVEESLLIRARTRLVKDDDDIELRINGRKHRFDFDRGSEILEARIDLRTGDNKIEIVAKNRNGEERLSRTIYRELPVQFPVVQFTSPAYNNAKVDNSIATIKVRIEHIEQSSAVQLLVNGRNEPNFYFDDQFIKADIELREGRNEVEVIAINARGEAKDQRTIIYERPYVPTIRRPRVRIIAPQYGQSTTREEVVPIRATLENVFRKSAIRMTNNGLVIYDFDFNPNTGNLRHNLYLREGINQLVIEVRNEAGRDRARATINFEVPILPPPPPVIVVAPSVDIIYPTPDAIIDANEITVKAIIKGVANERGIEFIVNGNDCIDFNFRPSTGRFRSTIPLQNGENEIIIKARTPGGRDRQKVIVFHEERHAPVIDFRASDNAVTQEKELKIKADIKYITEKRALKIFLNNREVRDFRFRNNQLTTTLSLKEGRNEIEILAENEYGRDSYSWSVRYERPQPPSVSFSNIRDNQAFRRNRIELKAVVEYVENPRDLKLFVNGVLANRVALNGRNFTAQIRLKEGRNSIELKARTDYGTDEQRIRVNYSKPRVRIIDAVAPVRKAPTIYFLTKDELETDKPSTAIKINVDNVAEKSDLTLQLNGKTIKDFDFRDGRLRTTVPLNLGENNLSLEAKNEGGKVKKEMTIIRKSDRAIISKGAKGRTAKLTKAKL